MSGIPVYTSSPIKPTKASGITPQTAAPGFQTAPIAPTRTSTSTTSAPPLASYPSARPGAAAMLAPTAAAQRYAPLQPTATTKTESDPPAPQPGAVPSLSSKSVAPPPKAGEAYLPQQTAAPAQPASNQLPHQMAYSPPTATYGAQPPKSVTSTTNTPSVSYPVAIPSAEADPRRSLEHPPGYHQDVYASELTSDQRRAQEAQLANETSSSMMPNAGNTDSFDSEGVWNTARKWAQQAGEKISEAEAEVWRKIGKE